MKERQGRRIVRDIGATPDHVERHDLGLPYRTVAEGDTVGLLGR